MRRIIFLFTSFCFCYGSYEELFGTGNFRPEDKVRNTGIGRYQFSDFYFFFTERKCGSEILVIFNRRFDFIVQHGKEIGSKLDRKSGTISGWKIEFYDYGIFESDRLWVSVWFEISRQK